MIDYIEERTYHPEGCDPDDYNSVHFRVGVHWRGNGKWAVTLGGNNNHRLLSSAGNWLWMPLKMTQMRHCRFDFETACRLAEAAVDNVTLVGKTWKEHEDAKRSREDSVST